MTRLAIIFSLLFVTPAWAVKDGCSFNFLVVATDLVKEVIKKNACEHIEFKTLSLGLIPELCRFDRAIITQESTGLVVCVPK